MLKSASAPDLALQLANLLRYVVYKGQQARVTLKEELGCLESFLALQQPSVLGKSSVFKFKGALSTIRAQPSSTSPNTNR
jgi:LytS/YehU family sensor histidine kinase